MKRTLVRLIALFAIALGVLTAPAQPATRTSGAAPEAILHSPDAPVNIQVSRDGVVPGASRSVTDFSEVMLAIDPTDPAHLLGASKFFFDPAAYKHYSGVFKSYDAGLSWTQRQPDGLELYAKTSDPTTTFDELGNGYFTLLTVRPLGVDMLKKPAAGGWSAPVVVDRGVTNGCIDTYLARSLDHGQTWSANQRVSAQSWDWTLNLPLAGGDGFIGDYQGIASSNAYDFPLWNATANLGQNPDNRQQIFVARVPAPAAASRRLYVPILVKS
jgi:hypothetical protein